MVEVLLLRGEKYLVHSVYNKEQELVSPTFPDLRIILSKVFDFPLETGEEPPVVKESPSPRYATDRSS